MDIDQPIIATQLPCDEHGNPIDYIVGRNCTRIEKFGMEGEYGYVPYIQVWNGGECLAEFCQHKASFVRFGSKRDLVKEAMDEPDNDTDMLGHLSAPR